MIVMPMIVMPLRCSTQGSMPSAFEWPGPRLTGWVHCVPAVPAAAQGATKERLQLERKLVACIDKIKAVYFSLMLHIVNTLTKKQIATMIVYAHPFVCDGLSFCEALDSLDV
jgi:hypothetical protein